MRPTVDETWLAVAKMIGQRSTCLRRAVGCVLIDHRGYVCATGYNGVAAGVLHCNEEEWRGGVFTYPHACSGVGSASGTNLDACNAVHAEQNAIAQCRDPRSIVTCYVTTAPCVTCAKMLRNTSCHRIIYLESYPHLEASKLAFLGENPENRAFFQLLPL